MMWTPSPCTTITMHAKGLTQQPRVHCTTMRAQVCANNACTLPPCDDDHAHPEPLHDNDHAVTVPPHQHDATMGQHDDNYAHTGPAHNNNHAHTVPCMTTTMQPLSPHVTTTTRPCSSCMTMTMQAHSPRRHHHTWVSQNPHMACTRPQNPYATMKTWVQPPCAVTMRPQCPMT